MKKNFFGLPCVLPFILGSALTLSSIGQETNILSTTNTLTLEAAVRLALANNPDIRVFTADIKSARGGLITATTWQNPELSVSPGAVVTHHPSTTVFHGDFGLEQTFEWPGKRALRRAVAEKDIVGRRLALEGFRTQLAIQVRRAYYSLLIAREDIALQQQQLALATSFAGAARKKVEGGFAPDFESTKAEVEIVTAKKSLCEAQARRASALITLNMLLGQKPDEPCEVTGTLDGNLTLPDEATLLEKTLALNPAIKVQAADAERSGLNLRSIRKSRMPDFKVGPNLEYTGDEQTIGLGVTLPLPFWDRKRGEIVTATAEQEKALAELEKLRREIFYAVAIASKNLVAAQESLGFYTPQLRAKLKSSLDAAAQTYADGRTPLWLYLELQRTYFNSQANYFESMQNFFERQAVLESAVGVPLDQFNQP